MAPRPGRRGRWPTAGAWRPVSQSTRWVEAKELDVRPGRPGQWWQQPPEPRGRDRTQADVPPGAKAAGPGLASKAPEPGSGSGSGASRPRGRGQGVLGAKAGCRNHNREEEQACVPVEGWEGVAGKAREGGRAGTRPPPFFGSLTGTGGLQRQAQLVGKG